MMKKFVMIGATLSGNKGAAGMVIALVQNLCIRYPTVNITLMSYYPLQDQKLNRYPNLDIVSGTPFGLVILFFLSVIAFIFKFVGLQNEICKMHKGLKAIDECDLFFDVGGVSFVDGREKYLPFNILWILPALILKKQVIKVSQALGPFEKFINRFFAQIFLPRIDLICARGRKTAMFLEYIGLKNFKQYPDIAFTLKLDDIREEVIKRNTFQSREKIVVGISPSQVVYNNCLKTGIDYPRIICGFIEQLLSKNYYVVLIPHSARNGSLKTRNNDLIILEIISSQLKNREAAFQIKEELTPSELRLIIGKVDFFITSRFHALISALYMKVPSLVIGWSHKYNELLNDFNLQNTALDFSELDNEILWNKFKELENKADIIRERINQNLPLIVEKSMGFYDKVDAILLNQEGVKALID